MATDKNENIGESGSNSNDEDNVNTLPTLKAQKIYRKYGYNRIPILSNGAKYDSYNRETKVRRQEVANGKSAAGIGLWREWIDTPEEDDTKIEKWFEEIERKLKSVSSNKAMKLSIGIIHGNASPYIVEIMDHRGKMVEHKTGSGVFECDGVAVDIFMEAVLVSGIRNQILRTPQVNTPSGGKHYLIRYIIERHDGKEINLKTESVYQGKGHSEIELLGAGRYSMAPPSTGYTLENNIDNVAILTMEEIFELVDTIKRVDKRATSGPLWTDKDKYKDLTNNQRVKYNYIDIAKTIYSAATNNNRRHDLALHYAGILKRYVKLTEEDTRVIIESMAPNDSKILEGVKDTYKKKDNQITSIVTFRKLVIELLGEEDGNEIINHIMQYAEPELQFNSSKPSGILLKLAVDNVEECIYDQDRRAHAIIKDQKTNSYQIIKLKSEEFNLNMSRWFIENNKGFEQAAREHKTQTVDTLTSLIHKDPITLHNRAVTMKEQNTVYYNLNNKLGQVVKITADIDGKGVTIIKQNPDLILFRKLPDNCRQLTPISIDDLKPNYDYLESLCTGIKYESHKLVFKCWTIALFFWSVSYGVPYNNGGERQGKTTLLKMAKI